MKFDLDGLTVYFPYNYVYPEQYTYMRELKAALDNKGHGCLEMPTGTGKTITILSLVTSYQLQHPEIGKLVYCTRTVPEMEKVLSELKELQKYRKEQIGPSAELLALGLSSRKNLCVHPDVRQEGSRESVDSKCRQLTASWVREKSMEARARGDASSHDLCDYFEEFERKGNEAVLPPGVYTLHDLRQFGTENTWCPYFLSRHMIKLANVVVYNYQYLLDPKVSQMVSRELERECVVVFDEAHNIDNVCIESMSVNLRSNTLSNSSRNISSLNRKIKEAKAEGEERLREEYNRLVSGLQQHGVVGPRLPAQQSSSGQRQRHDAGMDTEVDEAGNSGSNGSDQIAGGEEWLASPVIPQDFKEQVIPGNIRRADHFSNFLERLTNFLKTKLETREVISVGPKTFRLEFERYQNGDEEDASIQESSNTIKTMKWSYDRLQSLLKTLEIVNVDEFASLTLVADFASLLGSYDEGFEIIIEPYDERMPNVHDPVLQLSCLNAAIAIAPVFEKYQSVFITSGTLSPISNYRRLLGFEPVTARQLPMTLTRECLCPIIVTRGSDQLPISTKFDMRTDPAVMRNYGKLLVELATSVPDGMVCFFVSYSYMDNIVSQWNEMGILQELMHYKLVFIETQDVVETSLALDNFRRACNQGRGAVFLSVARGKVAEGIDFDRHYGRAVIMFGVPYQYTLSKVLKARLRYLQKHHNQDENDFLSFDAVRQTAQCVGRVIRSKSDYGMMVLADKRYNSTDKRGKLPQWISEHIKDAHLNMSTDMAVTAARDFFKSMAQGIDPQAQQKNLLDQEAVNRLAHDTTQAIAPPPPVSRRIGG